MGLECSNSFLLCSLSFPQCDPVQWHQLYQSVPGPSGSRSWPLRIQHDGADRGVCLCVLEIFCCVIKSGFLIQNTVWCVQVDHWLEFSARRLCDQSGVSAALGELDKALSLRTFLVGQSVTLADLSVWAALKGQYPAGCTSAREWCRDEVFFYRPCRRLTLQELPRQKTIFPLDDCRK